MPEAEDGTYSGFEEGWREKALSQALEADEDEWTPLVRKERRADAS